MSVDQWYLSIARLIYDCGYKECDKRSIVGQTVTFQASRPIIVRAKRTPYSTAIREMQWFLKGEPGDVSALEESGVKWWRPWFGDRQFVSAVEVPYLRHKEAFDRLSTGTQSNTRMLCNLWPDESQLSLALLPPCCYGYQLVKSDSRNLNMIVNQRSADLMCGVPANIAQYSWLLNKYAKLFDMAPGFLQFNFGNLHIYESHIETCEFKELIDTKLGDVLDLQLPTWDMTGMPIGYEFFKSLKFEVVPVHTNGN